MKTGKLLLSLAITLCVWSCTSNIDDNHTSSPQIPQEGESRVVLKLSAPGAFAVSRTRAMTAESENRIDDIYVLVFDDENLLFHIAQGTPAGGEGSFSVIVPSGPGIGHVRLVVLANAEQILEHTIGTDAAVASEHEYDVIARLLIQEITGAMYISGGVIPMWGETPLVEISATANNHNIALMRAIARVDVGVGIPEHNAPTGSYTWDGLDARGTKIPFELMDVYVIRPNNKYGVMPSRENRAADGSITHPTVPQGTSAFAVEESKSNFAFEVTNGLSTSRSIYIPEAEVVLGGTAGDAMHGQRMALVVGGSYAGGPETFYRIDFTDNGKLTDALRNHLYQFNIVGVTGAGYRDVETAYSSQSMNMAVQVLDWDEQAINDIEFDGSDYFALDTRTATFDPMGGQTIEVAIKTNVANFEMWSGGSKRFDAVALADGESYGGYEYTLRPHPGSSDEYILSIYCPDNNVSPTEQPQAKLIEWTFAAGRINMRFDVDQQWMKTYISIADGQSTRLMPEGTSTTPIAIDIMATRPVTVTSTASWVKGLSSAVLRNGVYTAQLKITVDAFRFGIDGRSDRTATITIQPEGEAPIEYKILHEAPYLRINRAEIFVPRPVDTSSPVTNTIEIFTNIIDTDLTLSRVNGDAAINFAGGRAVMEAFDPREPRYRRFEVATDFSGSPSGSRSANFRVVPAAKYGQLQPAEIEVRATDTGEVFDIFWRSAYFGQGTTDWAPPRYTDASSNYYLPWNTRVVEFDVVTNMGVAEVPSASSLGHASLTQGAPAIEGGYERYPFTLTLNNATVDAPQIYRVALRPLSSSSGAMRTFEVRVGARQFSLEAFTGNFSGAGSPMAMPLASNVHWRIISPAGWVRFSGGGATEFSQDDRFYTPTTSADGLTRETALQVSVDPMTVLNASDRSTVINIYNMDDNNAATPVNIRQWAPVLAYTSGLPTGNIPAAGAHYTINVKTNQQGWSVRIYDVTSGAPTLLVDETNTQNIDGAAASIVSSVAIDVPANNSDRPRNTLFALYRSGFAEVEAGRLTQEAKMTAAPRGIPAPPGVLGVGVASGQLTLRGSNQYAGTIYAANSEFGPLANEPVTVALFRWGSLVATSSDLNSNTLTATDILWKPTKYNKTLTSWSDLPYVTTTFPTTKVAQGLGDPCTFADGADGNAPWKIPAGNPWNGVDYTTSTLPIVVLTLSDGTSVTGRAAGNMFLPAAGGRNSLGEHKGWEGVNYINPVGGTANDGINGNYWSTSWASTGAYSLQFQNLAANTPSGGNIQLSVLPRKNSASGVGGIAVQAAAIRCVAQ